jgi:hypothetical protein
MKQRYIIGTSAYADQHEHNPDYWCKPFIEREPEGLVIIHYDVIHHRNPDGTEWREERKPPQRQ